jgi:glycosyltransferase involved in cell wall biosynthesis
VPPPLYGGIEWIVALLADGLALAGHDVTIFASGDSVIARARLASVYETAPSEHIGETYWDIRHVLACYVRQDEFDIVNDHSGMLAAAVGGVLHVPVVHTVHGTLEGEPGLMYEHICAVAPRVQLISISMNQRRHKPELPWLANCPNALDLSLYPFPLETRREDYLLFLGRMTAAKGAHRAIAVALETGLPLKLAGKCREPAELSYFEQFIRPYLGPRIEYVGEVSHGEKVELLQRARATLFPIRWEEPFGLVMIESMACGTPVIASRYGSVPEVVEDGVSGVIVDDYRDMPAALERADALDRAQIRRNAEERFAPERMVADYVRAYEAAIAAA